MIFNKLFKKKSENETARQRIIFSSYDFTVITACYNVAPYIERYLHSVTDQTLDFKNNINLILVNDGSTDDTLCILKKWQKKYPQNIRVISTENQGVSKARNEGIKVLENNKYVTFIDADDFVDKNYFYSVAEVLKKNETAVLVSCYKTFYFEETDSYSDSHPLKFKFNSKNYCYKITDLENRIDLYTNSAFFKSDIIRNHKLYFSEEIGLAEDALFLNLYLSICNKNDMVLYCKDAVYYYRKRSDKSSAIDSYLSKKSTYVDVPRHACLDLAEAYIKKYGEVPVNIQFGLIYHYFWIIKNNLNRPQYLYDEFLTEEDIAQFFSISTKVFSHIKIKTILRFNFVRGCSFVHKLVLAVTFKNSYPFIRDLKNFDYDTYEIETSSHIQSLAKEKSAKADSHNINHDRIGIQKETDQRPNTVVNRADCKIDVIKEDDNRREISTQSGACTSALSDRVTSGMDSVATTDGETSTGSENCTGTIRVTVADTIAVTRADRSSRSHSNTGISTPILSGSNKIIQIDNTDSEKALSQITKVISNDQITADAQRTEIRTKDCSISIKSTSGCEQEEYIKSVETTENEDAEDIFDLNIIYIEYFELRTGIVSAHFYIAPNLPMNYSLTSADSELKPIDNKVMPIRLIDRHILSQINVKYRLSRSRDADTVRFYILGREANISFKGKLYKSGVKMSLLREPVRSEFKKIEELSNSLEITEKDYKYKLCWLVMDRPDVACDNGEHFYRYLMKNHPEVNAIFVLDGNSSRYTKLKKEGFKLVPYGSDDHKLAYYQSSCLILSDITAKELNPFGDEFYLQKKVIFLQHGITKDNVSQWLNSKKKIDLFLTCTDKETESIAKDTSEYKFMKSEVKQLGFPRFDKLYRLYNRKLQNIIPNANMITVLVQPSWRSYLANMSNEEFITSDYFINWSDLLQSLENVLNNPDIKNYKIIFAMHPHMLNHGAAFNLSKNVEIQKDNTRYQQNFVNADLLITDYSSVFTDFGLMRKPVIYFQFDQEKFWAEHSYSKGYFDYVNDGFGPVCTSAEEVIVETENLMKTGFDNSEYIERYENFYKSKDINIFDGKNCERLYRAIVKIN